VDHFKSKKGGREFDSIKIVTNRTTFGFRNELSFVVRDQADLDEQYQKRAEEKRWKHAESRPRGLPTEIIIRYAYFFLRELSRMNFSKLRKIIRYSTERTGRLHFSLQTISRRVRD